MMPLIIALALTPVAGPACPACPAVSSADDVLQYDDGTAWWVTWGGQYRGTWFNTADFYPEPCDFIADAAEFWFYHPASWWVADQFVTEVYNGDRNGPTEMLYDTTVTAEHYTAVMVDLPDSLQTAADFWLVVNTEFSSGGWPSSLGDNSPNSSDHSFFSYDGEAWEPWIVEGGAAFDYLIRAHGEPVGLGLEAATWGGIKTLYH